MLLAVLIVTPFMPVISPIIIGGALASLANKFKKAPKVQVNENNHVFDMYSERIVRPANVISDRLKINKRKEDLSVMKADQQMKYF